LFVPFLLRHTFFLSVHDFRLRCNPPVATIGPALQPVAGGSPRTSCCAGNRSGARSRRAPGDVDLTPAPFKSRISARGDGASTSRGRMRTARCTATDTMPDCKGRPPRLAGRESS
jgi:hypothetical protein